jgi:ATP-dependent helicase HepA
MDTPLAGQRWMSESEPELGLGLVLEADASCVRLLFPLRGETRRYSLESAALRRLLSSRRLWAKLRGPRA